MAAQYFASNFKHLTADACIDDTTPPTFAGIATITDLPNGSLRVDWLTATDGTNPIRYEVYIQATTATGLFTLSNIAYVTYNLSIDIYQLANGDRLAKNVTYYVGIRAVDAVGNRETNTVSLNEVSAGVLDDDMATIAANLATTANDIDNDADRIEQAANLILTTVL